MSLSRLDSGALLSLPDVALDLRPEDLVLPPQPAQLLPLVVPELHHLQRAGLVAQLLLLLPHLAPGLPGLRLLVDSLDVVLASHVTVERVLAGNSDQTQLALEHRHPAALLLVVGALLVSLHLVPGPHPHVAALAVQFLPLVAELAVVVVSRVELGLHLVQPGGVEEPLLLGPQ